MEETKRRKGCWGCGLVLVALVVLLVGWVAAMRWGVLEKLGLRQPIAEQVFAPPPDREASTALLGALQQAGMDTQGVGVAVLPMAGQEGSVAILTLDASQGFDPQRLTSGEGDWDAIERLLDQGGLEDLGVTRLAFDYVDQDGKSIVTLTASSDALRRFGQGEMDEKALLREVMGRIDIAGLTREMTP
ncbi:MAG: hypothetical protein ACYC5M_11570 [Anaerolineae bacterium]